jgi:peptidoglycan/LPS O-acetylase OafA/YrhL
MKKRLPWLDLLRGAAALLVVLEHLRAFLFPTYTSLQGPGVFLKGLYFLTGLGHQAVLVFFVLSGFLVGGSVLRSLDQGNWSWDDYLLNRLCRLWVVLLPALLLTMFLDAWGRSLQPSGYAGIFRDLYHSGPVQGAPSGYTPLVFFGNLLFLQTILVPCFGTDSPLWSLANEFWYYLLFPLLVRVFFPGPLTPRIGSLAAGGLLLWFLPGEFLSGFAIWIMGAMTFRAVAAKRKSRFLGIGGFLLALMLAGGVLIWSRWTVFPWADLLLGASLLPLIGTLSLLEDGSRWLIVIASGLSSISYTLYLVHFPFLALIFFTLFKGRQIIPNTSGVLCYVAILTLVCLFSSVVWWCFERNTALIKDRVKGFLLGSKRWSVSPDR